MRTVGGCCFHFTEKRRQNSTKFTRVLPTDGEKEKTNKMFWVFFVIFAAALSFGVWYYVSQKEREQVYTDLAEEAKTEEPEKETEEEHNLSFRKMVLNRDTYQVKVDGKILPKITKQEFAILELLLRNPKQVFSKEDIFEYAWDEPYMGETKTLDVHISNIRKKIKTVTSEEYIETVWGIGYRLHV